MTSGRTSVASFTIRAWSAFGRRGKKGEEGEGEMPVVFMHAPSLPEKDDVEKGTKVNIALIKGIAESIGK